METALPSWFPAASVEADSFVCTLKSGVLAIAAGAAMSSSDDTTAQKRTAFPTPMVYSPSGRRPRPRAGRE